MSLLSERRQAKAWDAMERAEADYNGSWRGMLDELQAQFGEALDEYNGD